MLYAHIRVVNESEALKEAKRRLYCCLLNKIHLTDTETDMAHALSRDDQIQEILSRGKRTPTHGCPTPEEEEK